MNLKLNFNITTHKLDNGLDLILIPKKNAEIISLNLAYKVGSKNEIRGKTGMAHLFEHLMFEGSKHIPKGEFDKICSMAGGTNNAYTSYDYTAYTMTIPSNQLEVAFWLESDRMLEFAVTEEAMETQQKVVSEEIRQTVFDRPYGRWRELLAKNAFTDDSSYSWEVHGTIDDVLAVKLDYLKEFFETYYRPDNAILSISGNLDIEKTILLAEKYFSEIENKQIQRIKPVFSESMLKKGKYESFKDNVPLPATFINFHIPSMLDDRIYTANVISEILSNGRSSRLYSELVEQKQTASTVGTYVDDREFTSLFTIYGISASPGQPIEKLREEILSIISRLKETAVKKEELERAVNQLTTQVASEILYSSGLADITSSNLLFSNDLNRIYGILEKYKNITAEDIMEFAKDFFITNDEIIIECLPE